MSYSITIKGTKVKVGDTVKINYKFKEGNKEKTQVFQGILMAVKGKGNNKMILVRKVTKDNLGVERIFPLVSPYLAKVSLEKKGKTRRGKIYFIRGLTRKRLRDKLSSILF